MILDDFVMLGRTVPEHSKKHGVVACSAGYSREYGGFLRIYPLPMDENIPRWSICTVALERPKTDNRKESFRIKDGTSVKVVGKADRIVEFDYLDSLQSVSVASLNQDRESLAILRPREMSWRFDKMKPGEEHQMQLGLTPCETEQTLKPRLQFSDEHGRHDLQIRDWGATVFLQKGFDAHKLWPALKIDNPQYEHLLFCGNHNVHRNNWLVISLISRKINANMDLFAND